MRTFLGLGCCLGAITVAGTGVYLKTQPDKRSYLYTNFSRTDDGDNKVINYKYELFLHGDTRLAKKIPNPVVTVSIAYYPSLQTVDLLWFKNEYSSCWPRLPGATWKEARAFKSLGVWTLAQALNDIERKEERKPLKIDLEASGVVPFKSPEGLFRMYQKLGFVWKNGDTPEMSGKLFPGE